MEPVILEKRDRIAWVTLNRPEALNALDDGLNDALWAVWEEFAADAAVDVAILTGAGKSFCAGADLRSFIPRLTQATPQALRESMARGIGGGLTRGQHTLTKPVIAAVNGHALGGGFELALACDLRIVSERARFGIFEVRHGLHPGDGGLVRLVAIAGTATALDLVLTGREVDAEEAFRLGLVNRVVPHEELLESAEETARLILRNSQSAIRSAKETIHGILGRTLDDALRLEHLNGYTCTPPGEIAARLEVFFGKRGGGG